jgi:hypothetical protein
MNPERVGQPPNPFRVEKLIVPIPRVLAALEPWAEIMQRHRRLLKTIMLLD